MAERQTGAQAPKIGYVVRWSTKGQTGNYRGKEQDEAMPGILRERGYEPVPYHEGQVSGRDLAKRDTALDMLADVETGIIQGIGGWDVKRLTRDETGMDAGRMIRLCMDRRALICVAERDYRVWQRQGLKDFKRDALEAGENVLDIRDTFWDGHVGRAKREPYFLGQPATGYTTELEVIPPSMPGERTRYKNHPRRDETQSDMMAEVGKALDECQTLTEVVRRLNASGYLPVGRRGETRGHAVRWNLDRLENIIGNPLYVGVWTWGRRMNAKSAIRNLPAIAHGAIQQPATINEGAIFTHAVPGLSWYDEGRQRAWQAKYVQPADRPKVRTRTHSRPLRGVLACFSCGQLMVSHGQQGYACPQPTARIASGPCKHPQCVGQDAAFNELWRLLPVLLAERADALETLRSIAADGGPLADRRAQLEQIKAGLSASVASYNDGFVLRAVPADLQAKWATVEAEIARREAEIASLERATLADTTVDRVYALLSADPARARDKMTLEQQGAFFRGIVSDVRFVVRGRGRHCSYAVGAYRNLMVSDEVAGATSGDCPAYLTRLLD